MRMIKMLPFIELASLRRSVRDFKPQKVEKEKINRILDAVFMSPSSKNSRTSRIVVSDDPAVCETVSRMRSTGSAFVKDAPLLFFVMGDESQTDLWRENCAIFAATLQYAATAEGLGSCWVHVNGRPHSEDNPNGQSAEDFLRENVPGLPPYRILCVIAAGYPAEGKEPRRPRDNSDKIFFL